jgi:hypothetical protein
VLGLGNQFGINWGNKTATLRWNSIINPKLFSNTSLIYSDYYYGLQLDFIGFKYDSGIRNYNIKYDFKNYITDKVKINYGVNGIYYDFNPGTINPIGTTSGINYRQLDKKYAFEPSAYIEAEHQFSRKFSVMYGLRYSMFYRLGASTVNLYENNIMFNYVSIQQKCLRWNR